MDERQQTAEEFKITLNDSQKEALINAGYEGFAKDTDDMMFYIHSLTDWLESHNKNYNREQYDRIAILNELLTAIYKNY